MNKYKQEITIESTVLVLSILTFLLAILKLIGILSISWSWVLFPLWAPVLLLAFLLLFLKHFG